MDLQVVLKPGKQIELNIRDSEGNLQKLKTLIESGFSGNTLGVISPIHEGNYFPLHPNDKFDVVFDVINEAHDNKKDVYSMTVMVLERRKIDGQSVIILSKIGQPKKVQRRNTYRLHILKNITYTHMGKTNQILLKNVSATGLRGIIEERIPHDTEITIHFDLENDEDMDMKCRVIACDQVTHSMIQFDLRLQFIDLNSGQKDKISNFINRKQSEALKKTMESEGRSKFQDMLFTAESNRRRGGDFIVRIVPILGLITWFISLAIFALIAEARPEAQYNLDIYFNFYKRSHWRADLLDTAFFSALLELLVCSLGLYLNSKRMKREGDQYNRGLIINLVFSIIVITGYILMPVGQ